MTERVAILLGQKGFLSVTEFLASIPGISVIKAAELLSDGRKIFPLALVAFRYLEAKLEGNVRDAAIDMFVRETDEFFPNGWLTSRRPDVNPETEALTLVSGWSSSIQVSGECPEYGKYTTPIGNYIYREHPFPIGWIPSGTDDPLLVSIFDKFWPKSVTRSEMVG
jgi:hypothetical protein